MNKINKTIEDSNIRFDSKMDKIDKNIEAEKIKFDRVISILESQREENLQKK